MKDEDYDYDSVAFSLIKKFSKNTELQTYKLDLVKLTRFKKTSIKEIYQFCLESNYIPYKYQSKSFVECFFQEQTDLNEILSAYQKQALKPAHIRIINSHLADLRPQAGLFNQDQMTIMNKAIGAATKIEDKKWVPNTLAITYRGNTSAQIWMMVVSEILREQVVKTCLDCAGFFFDSYSKRESNYCELCNTGAYRKRRSRRIHVT